VRHLGFGESVSATSRTLGSSAAPVAARRIRLETGRAVTLRITPGQARVFLDGRFIGVADDWNGLTPESVLAPGGAGTHQLRIAHPGRRELLVELVVRPLGAAAAMVLEERLAVTDQGREESGTPSAPSLSGKIRRKS